jgi:hypothetical protein
MVMTIDIPDKVVKHAAELGVPVDALISQAIEQIGDEPGSASMVHLGDARSTQADRDAAADTIREIASRNTLGGLKIKDLMNEGRKY